MTSTAIKVPFYGETLYLINKDGEPFVPMKPVVEGMGLTWQSQHEKLKQRFSKGITQIVIPSAGGKQAMTCLAFRKFAAWLSSLNPNKVKPEIRDKVIQYQNECDDVLYEYWTTGEVKRRASLPSTDTPALTCKILATLENGVTVQTTLVPADWYVGSITGILEVIQRRGVVVLLDEREQREFVRSYALSRL